VKIKEEQKTICDLYGVELYESPAHLKVGISYNSKNRKLFPINGLRHTPKDDTTGWYIWAGDEFSTNPNFFVPLHVEHIIEWRPEILKYLGLPPGYRFLIGENNYVDVWFDENLLDI
jgi:hypothetical protein